MVEEKLLEPEVEVVVGGGFEKVKASGLTMGVDPNAKVEIATSKDQDVNEGDVPNVLNRMPFIVGARSKLLDVLSQTYHPYVWPTITRAVELSTSGYSSGSQKPPALQVDVPWVLGEQIEVHNLSVALVESRGAGGF